MGKLIIVWFVGLWFCITGYTYEYFILEILGIVVLVSGTLNVIAGILERRFE